MILKQKACLVIDLQHDRNRVIKALYTLYSERNQVAVTPADGSSFSFPVVIDFNKSSYPEGFEWNTRVNFDTEHDWIVF